MIQITNEERLRILLTYTPCKIIIDGDARKLVGVNWGENAITIADYPDEMCESILECHYLNWSEVLSLKSLSSITNDDAVAIMYMDYGDRNSKEGVEFTEISEVDVYGDGITVGYRFKDKITKFGSGTRYFSDFNTKQTDFLRSKGYNVGYGKYSPQDLVDAGIVKYE